MDIRNHPEVKGFSVIKRRWVVERTIGWLMQHRRLARDYQTRPTTSATMIRIAMIDNLTRRATDETTPTCGGRPLSRSAGSLCRACRLRGPRPRSGWQ